MTSGPIKTLQEMNDARAAEYGWRKVASGIWFYDRTVPMPASIYAKPARLSSSRYDEDDHLDENRPIPVTMDGFVYHGWPGNTGEHLTLEEAKAAADAKPWGPIIWDAEPPSK